MSAVSPFTRTANAIVRRAIDEMEAAGVPLSITVDRLLTYGAGYAAAADGKAITAANFRRFAEAIDAGLFDQVHKPATRN